MPSFQEHNLDVKHVHRLVDAGNSFFECKVAGIPALSRIHVRNEDCVEMFLHSPILLLP